MVSSPEKRAWTLDQVAKSEFFHQKLHEWQLIEVAREIDRIKGEHLAWDKERLGISERAWNKVIHRGIKPVIIFTHPQILQEVPRSLGYYRMLAMVSQKSMIRVGLSGKRYEEGAVPASDLAWAIAPHLNKIISLLVEADEKIDAREFDLWRGMAAGSQAQGSWQNTKGKRMEIVIKGMIQRRLREKKRVSTEDENVSRLALHDGRTVVFADEPDIGLYDEGGTILAAVEVKGGIDTAGVFERIGAAIKSLSRAKIENPEAVTILILQGVSMTSQSIEELNANNQVVNRWFTTEDALEDEKKREEIFELLAI